MIETLNLKANKNRWHRGIAGVAEKETFEILENKLNEVIAQINKITEPSLLQKVFNNPNAETEPCQQ